MDDTMNTLPVLPVHPFTGLTAVGVLPSGKVVWPVLGGSGEGDDDPGEQADEETVEQETDDSADADEPGEDDGKQDKPADEKTVSRSELAKVIAARDAAKKQLRDLRREVDDLKRKGETADETAVREAEERATQKIEAKYKPISVRNALLESGVKSGRVKVALKLVNLDEVEIDEDGEAVGLDSQVTSMRQEWPELFADAEPEKKPEPRRPARGADGADKKAPPKKELTASEKQALKLLGKA